MSLPRYALVSPVPYIRPAHQGTLTIPAGATARQESGLHEDHKRDLTPYHTTMNIDRDLKTTIEEAIDPIYLKDL